MTENTRPEPELSEQDRIDLASIGVDPDTGEQSDAPDHALLDVWLKVLEPVEDVRAQRVPAGVAHRIIRSWPVLRYQETPAFHHRYHDHLLNLRGTLEHTLREHPTIRDYVGEDDAVENREHILRVLAEWDIYFDDVEREWDAAAEDSHIEIAALTDARGFVFGETGLVGHLAVIGLQVETDEYLELIQKIREEQ